MKLEKFRVANYRSIKDSGWVEVGGRTTLVGGNESGKTNLLMALRGLDASETVERLSINRDFPADRLRSEHSDDLDVVRTVWSLSEQERAGLAKVFPQARDVARVEVGRGYDAGRWVKFCELPESEADRAKDLLARLNEALGAEVNSDPARSMAREDLAQAMEDADKSPRDWSDSVLDAASALLQPLQLGQGSLPDAARDALEEIRDLARQRTSETEQHAAGTQFVLRQLPHFMFLEEYPEIDGEQNLAELCLRQREEQPEPGDEYFEMLLKVAGIDPDNLEDLLKADPETRRQMASRAGASLTRTLRELWSDRALKVRFNLDGEHFNTLIADPTSLYDVEINLNERSRGFRWFFSFCVMLAASMKDGGADRAVLLLDEPGLHLHAVGQRDLLAHLAALPNQVLLTTQSPFMVPTDELESVRTVNFCEDEGTQVSNTPAGDEKTMLPIMHAIGSEVARGLFQGGSQLLVAEITDAWYLRLASQFLTDLGKPALPRGMSLDPAGGSIRIPYLLALLSGQPAQSMVLLGECAGMGESLVTKRLAEHQNLIFLADALEPRPDGPVDVEDLLDPESYDRFVRFAYRRILKDRGLEPDPSIPGMVRRYEDAFDRLGMEFSRSRPARLILRAAAQNPKPIFPDASRENFERLFALIRKRVEPSR